MWLLTMFDLPVKSKLEMREANRYRKFLLDQGFDRVQLSIYAKYFINGTGSVRVRKSLQLNLPEGGSVMILKLNDAVWASAEVIENSVPKKHTESPPQLLLFE